MGEKKELIKVRLVFKNEDYEDGINKECKLTADVKIPKWAIPKKRDWIHNDFFKTKDNKLCVEKVEWEFNKREEELEIYRVTIFLSEDDYEEEGC